MTIFDIPLSLQTQLLVELTSLPKFYNQKRAARTFIFELRCCNFGSNSSAEAETSLTTSKDKNINIKEQTFYVIDLNRTF